MEQETLTAEPTTTAITVFMLVKTQPEWLSMAVTDRFAQLKTHVEPLLRKYQSKIKLRFYDAEFYSARVTDVWVWEVREHHAYELLVEDLRETPFWDRYFSIVEILPAVENAYAANYNRPAITG